MLSVVSLDLKNNEYLFNKRLSRIRILSSFITLINQRYFIRMNNDPLEFIIYRIMPLLCFRHFLCVKICLIMDEIKLYIDSSN